MLTTPSFCQAMLGQAGDGEGVLLGRTLSDLATAQTRLQGLDEARCRRPDTGR